MTEERTRRSHDKLPGEATLSMLLPKGYTLASMLAIGIAYAAFTYANIEATAENVQAVQQTQAQHSERLIALENNDAVQNERLMAIRQEQRQLASEAKDDRAEILQALKRLGRD